MLCQRVGSSPIQGTPGSQIASWRLMPRWSSRRPSLPRGRAFTIRRTVLTDEPLARRRRGRPARRVSIRRRRRVPDQMTKRKPGHYAAAGPERDKVPCISTMAAPRKSLDFDPIEEARRQWRVHGWDAAAPGMAAVTSIMRAHQIYLARVDAALRPFDLTFARYELLMLLSLSR